MRALCIATVAIGCVRAPLPGPTVAQELELSPLDQFVWLLGDFAGDDQQHHWIAAGGTLYGVAFAPGTFEAYALHDERDPGHFNGTPWLVRVDELGETEHMRRTRGTDRIAEFAAEGAVGLLRDGERLLVVHRRGRTEGLARLQRFAGAAAPDLEQADRALALAVTARDPRSPSSAEAWLAGFAPDGIVLCEECVAGSRVSADALIEPRAALGRFDWAPLASRVHGNRGVTVGHIAYRSLNGSAVWRGSYLAVWRRFADTWRIVFYTRRASRAELRDPES